MSYFRAWATWDRGGEPAAIGELTDLPMDYYKGQNEFHLAGRKYCGSLEAITGGGRTGTDPPITLDDHGQSDCCDAIPALAAIDIEGAFDSGGVLHWPPLVGFPAQVRSYFWLYYPFPTEEIPISLSGWEAIQALRYTPAAAAVWVYRSIDPNPLNHKVDITASGAFAPVGLIGHFSPGLRKPTVNQWAQIGVYNSGTYTVQQPAIEIPSPRSVLLRLWIGQTADSFTPLGPGGSPVGDSRGFTVMGGGAEYDLPIGVRAAQDYTLHKATTGPVRYWQTVITGE